MIKPEILHFDTQKGITRIVEKQNGGYRLTLHDKEEGRTLVSDSLTYALSLEGFDMPRNSSEMEQILSDMGVRDLARELKSTTLGQNGLAKWVNFYSDNRNRVLPDVPRPDEKAPFTYFL